MCKRKLAYARINHLDNNLSIRALLIIKLQIAFGHITLLHSLTVHSQLHIKGQIISHVLAMAMLIFTLASLVLQFILGRNLRPNPLLTALG